MVTGGGCSTSSRRIGLLAGGLAGFGIWVHMLANTIYANALMAKFKITHVQYENMVAVMLMGNSLQVLPGLIYDHFGSRVTVFLGFLGVSLGYSMLMTATNFTDFFHGNVEYLAVSYLILSHFTFYAFIAANGVCVASFPSHHQSKVIAFFSCGAAIIEASLITAYTKIFIGEHIYDAENQDLTGYFVMCAILCAALSVVAFCGLKKMAWSENESVPEEIEEETSKNYLQNIKECFTADFSSIEYQLLAFISIVNLAFVTFIISNTSIISRSLLISGHDWTVISLPVFAGLPFKIAFAILTDCFGNCSVTRAWHYLIVNVIGMLSLPAFLSPMLPGYEIVSMISLRFFIQFNVMGLHYIVPILLQNLCHERFFGTLFGYTICMGYLVASLFNVQFGLFYEHQRVTNSSGINDGHYCYHDDCYRSGFVIPVICVVLSVVCNVVLILILRRRRESESGTNMASYEYEKME